jgi:Fe2+ transport system protein FeoA
MSPLTKAKKDTMLVFSAFGNIVESEKQKLTEMGLIPGESITLLQNAKNGYITFILKGSRDRFGLPYCRRDYSKRGNK